MEPATVAISLAALWAAYAGSANSGRFPCPVRVREGGTASHIYRGFGAIRLERIAGSPKPGRGFQGEEIASAASATEAASTRIRIED